jgi:hypothetical protein
MSATIEIDNDEINALRQRCRDLKSDTLSYSAMAREAAIGESTFNLWLNENYTGDYAKVAEKVRRWLDSRHQGELARSMLPQAPDFVETPTVTRITALLAYAHHVPTMGVISGGAGIGKTIAVKRYAENNPNVFVLTGEPSQRTPNVLLSYLAEVLGMTERTGRRSRMIIERLRGIGALLIVDEAHHYPTRCLDQLRSIYDQAECGLALLGNVGIYKRLEGEGRTDRFAPLFRRIGMRLTLPRPQAADITALVAAWGINGEAERRVLEKIGMRPGALGGMNMTLRMAHMLAGSAPISAEHIKRAYRQLNEVTLDAA